MGQQGLEVMEGFTWEEARREGARRWDSKGSLGLVAGSYRVSGPRTHEKEGNPS